MKMNNRINEIKEALSILQELHSSPLGEEHRHILEEEIIKELLPRKEPEPLQSQCSVSHNEPQQYTTPDYPLPPIGIQSLPYNHPGRVLVSQRILALGHKATRSNITKVCLKVVDTYIHRHNCYPPREITNSSPRVTYVYLTRDIPLIDSVVKQVLGNG